MPRPAQSAVTNQDRDPTVNQYYLNTDLALQADESLAPLAEILDRECKLLYAKPYGHVSAEARGSGTAGDPASSPERDIASLLDVLEALSAEHRALVDRCTSFEFNIGWQSTEQRPEGAFTVGPELLARVGALGATLAVTIYPSSEADEIPG